MTLISTEFKIISRRIRKPRVRGYYPQIRGLDNLVLEDRINSQIKSIVDKLILEQGYYENPLTELIIDYEIIKEEENTLSLYLSNNTCIEDSPDLTITKSVSFDIKRGKVLSSS